jgi:hypothetical protein
MYYVEDREAQALCYVIDKKTGVRLSSFAMGNEPEIDQETEAIVGAPTWDNLTNNHGAAVDYAAWEMDQNSQRLVFLGLVKRPEPCEMAAPYQKAKLGSAELTDKQMFARMKCHCDGCGKEEKEGKRPVRVRVYRKGIFCPDCAEERGLGDVSSVSRYTQAGYLKHASEKGNLAIAYADGTTYEYHYNDLRATAPSYMWGGRKYNMVPVTEAQENAA